MQLRVGDRVKFLNETGGGKITRLLDHNRVELEAEDGFTYTYDLSELLYDGDRTEVAQYIDDQKIDQILDKVPHGPSKISNAPRFERPGLILDYLAKSRQYWTARNRDFIEIDLHIEELVNHPGHLEPWRKIEIQIEHCRVCLDQAMSHKIARLIFIHGVGEGRLREEIRKLFDSYPEIDYHDAPFQHYGQGATEVIIRGIHT